MSTQFHAVSTIVPKSAVQNPLKRVIARWLNRGLSDARRIELQIGWPLWLIPVVLINQIFAPHAVWVVLLITLCGLYAVSYLWVRSQAPAVTLTRRRLGAILVAGDLLQEEFELKNESLLPLLWAEFVDDSTVPGYTPGRVVACEGQNVYRWRTEVLCQQRGLYQLGPHLLRMQDPLGIFSITVTNLHEEVVLIYPRVVHLPHLKLPRGNAQGGERQRRPVLGNLPAATVTEYRHGDSLRHVHWLSSARRGRMMVKELEIEPSGHVWIALDLNHAVQQGEGPTGTLEHGIVVAASIAADLLSDREQRAVGLLAYSGDRGDDGSSGRGRLVQVSPAVGSTHLWPILTALAPVTEGELSMAALLASNRERIGRRSTLVLITPVEELEPNGGQAHGYLEWIAELVHLRGVGVNSSVVLVAAAESDSQGGDAVQALLARLEIPCSLVVAGAPLPAFLTFRRRRRVVRTTPTGGVVSYEVDEEVG